MKDKVDKAIDGMLKESMKGYKTYKVTLVLDEKFYVNDPDDEITILATSEKAITKEAIAKAWSEKYFSPFGIEMDDIVDVKIEEDQYSEILIIK